MIFVSRMTAMIVRRICVKMECHRCLNDVEVFADIVLCIMCVVLFFAVLTGITVGIQYLVYACYGV